MIKQKASGVNPAPVQPYFFEVAEFVTSFSALEMPSSGIEPTAFSF